MYAAGHLYHHLSMSGRVRGPRVEYAETYRTHTCQQLKNTFTTSLSTLYRRHCTWAYHTVGLSEDGIVRCGDKRPMHLYRAQKRRQFLEDALATMAESDPIKLMLEDIKVITEDPDISRKEGALDDLLDHCEDIDLAKDFDTIGGYNLLERLLRSDHDGLRWRAAGLIAALVQNNPYWQQRALQLKLLPTLLTILDTDSCAMVRIKSLSAISCMARDNQACQEVFLKSDGFSALLRAMQAEDEKLKTKAAFMIRAMVVSNDQFKDVLCEIGMVEQFVGLLRREHGESHEHILGALQALVSQHKPSMAECQRSDLGLQQLLEDSLPQLKDKPEHQEEYSYTLDLLKTCFSDCAPTVDR